MNTPGFSTARSLAVAAAVAVASVALIPAGARAQGWPQNPGTPSSAAAPPPATSANPMCARLEGQLSALDRGSGDAARSDQVKRYEDAANKQQFELDRLTAQARRAGCEGLGFFSLFGGQPPQCDTLNAQIQRMRANLDRINMDLQRLQRGSPDLSDQKRAILIALAQNDCGPQYRTAFPQRPRGLFESLFGAPSVQDYGTAESTQSSTYRTICVRTCDGFYFPISFSTVQNKFQDDERICQRMCPSAEVMLYSHRNPGEEVAQAVSLGGRPYRELPNAFRYRSEYNPSCSCKRPGQSWADALGQKDGTLEQGDIVVTEERAKAMSQPRPEPSKAGRQDTRRGAEKGGKGTPSAVTAPPSEDKGPAAAGDTSPTEKRSVRTVGPTYYPTR